MDTLINKMMIEDKILIEEKKGSEDLKKIPDKKLVRLFLRSMLRYINKKNICDDIKMRYDHFYKFIFYQGEITDEQLIRLSKLLTIFGFTPVYKRGYRGLYNPQIDRISKIVCKYFNMPVEYLAIPTRKREIVQPRQISMYFSKQLTKSSLAVIGSQIGGKDHATVIHACNTVNDLIETDSRFKEQIDEIAKQIL
jgi:hypothetical protein